MNRPDELGLVGPGSTKDDGSLSAPTSGDLEDRRLFSSIRMRMFGREGTVLIGRYRLEGRLGAGAMGEVFLARDPELDRLVAIKLVHAYLADERFAMRLRREAKALARLVHPNVVRVYEVGEHEGRVFLAMEYVPGQSLREWIAVHEPSWREVLAAYVQAGRGLAAAHRADLTHRDFKPDNVLRGDDGRILVVDFGLAGLEDETLDGDQRSSAAGEPTEPSMPLTDLQLSRTGEIKGTPAYMPPEQFRGLPVDGRADQFALCVALFEGLWGTRPFAEESMRMRMAASLRGPTPPRDRKGVPEWVWPVIARGLAHEPSERWASMEDLLGALEAIPRRRRRRRQWLGLGLGLGVTAGAAGVLGAHWGGGPAAIEASCEDLEDELHGAWDDARRGRVRRAFEATDKPLATETLARIERDLDAWSARWVDEYAVSCRATRRRGTQSEAMLDRRTACMQRARRQVTALVDVLESADADVLARAGQLMAQLPDLGACSVASLEAGAAPVVEAAHQSEVEIGQQALAQARAELAVGRPTPAAALAEQARRTGQSVRHAPLELEARAMLAEITIRSGQLDSGLEVLREVVLAAERAELLELAADLRVQLAREAAGDFAQPRLERWLIDEAQLALERVARPADPREVVLQSARARIVEQAGDFAEAIAAHEQAYALAEGRMGDGPRAMLRVGVGTAKYRNGDYEGARAELLEARQTAIAAWGPRTPEVARIEFNLGMIATDLGDFGAATQYLDSAIATDAAVWGTESIEVARDRFARAYLAFGAGEIDQGCEAIADVLAVYEAQLGTVHDETASAMNAHALCRYHAGDDEGALEGYQRALEVQRQLLGDDHDEVGLVHANIGETQLALGQLDASLASYERAYEIMEAALPADHPELALPLKGRALVWLVTGQEARALADLERALSIADASQALELAEIRFGLARALVAVHGEREQARALQLARRALGDFEHGGVERRARDVRAWLDRQPG